MILCNKRYKTQIELIHDNSPSHHIHVVSCGWAELRSYRYQPYPCCIFQCSIHAARSVGKRFFEAKNSLLHPHVRVATKKRHHRNALMARTQWGILLADMEESTVPLLIQGKNNKKIHSDACPQWNMDWHLVDTDLHLNRNAYSDLVH
jgi:hypothetical protein